MKDTIGFVIIAFLAIGIGIYVRQSPIADYKMEGTVLQIEDGYALVAKQTNLTEADLLKSTDEWMYGDYDLIYVGPIQNVEPGMEIRLVIQGPVSSSYPARAEIESYQVIN